MDNNHEAKTPITQAQVNGRVINIINSLIKKDKFDTIKVYYKKNFTIIFLDNEVYTVSDERDIIKFKESVKFLLK